MRYGEKPKDLHELRTALVEWSKGEKRYIRATTRIDWDDPHRSKYETILAVIRMIDGIPDEW